MRERQLGMPHFAGANHIVGLSGRRHEWLFHVDMAPMFCGSNGHLAMLVDPAWPDGHNLQLLLGKHLTVVRVGLGSLKSFLSIRSSGFVVVSNGNHFGLGDFGPNRINPV